MGRAQTFSSTLQEKPFQAFSNSSFNNEETSRRKERSRREDESGERSREVEREVPCRGSSSAVTKSPLRGELQRGELQRRGGREKRRNEKSRECGTAMRTFDRGAATRTAAKMGSKTQRETPQLNEPQ